MKRLQALLMISIFLYPLSLIFPQQLSGIISNESGQALAGANIYLMNSNTGTSSNKDGVYLIKLNPGQHKIIFSFIGYDKDTVEVVIKPGEKISLDIRLKSSAIISEDVVVYSDSLSDAERLIRNVIDKKDKYLRSLLNYTYDSYTKTVLSISKNDTMVIGGILETQSEAYFKYPDYFKEIITGKKQTKNFNESYNIFTIGKVPDVLNEFIRIDELQIVSPVNTNALDYYTYEISDTLYSGNHRIFVLSFSPKDSQLPYFEGELNIVDQLYTINLVKLYGKDRIKTSLREDIVITEEFREYENYFWLPVSINFNFILDMNFPGLPPIYFSQSCLISDYNLNNKNFNFVFDDVLLVDQLAVASDSSRKWNSNQVIPLTNEELKAFHKIDSVITNAGFLPRAIIYLTQISPEIASLPLTGFSDIYHHNSVEGNYIGIGLDSKELLGNIQLTGLVGAGTKDNKWKYNSSLKISSQEKDFVFYANIFDELKFLNPNFNYSKFDITLNSLIDNSDYAGYYYSEGWKTGFNFSPVLNLNFDFSISVQRIYNTSNTDRIFDKSSPSYGNLPKVEEGLFQELGFGFTYSDLKYFDLGWTKEADNTNDFTRLVFLANLSSPKILTSRYSYKNLFLSFSWHRTLSMYADIYFTFQAGRNYGKVLLRNFFHLSGSFGSYSTSSRFRTVQQDIYFGKGVACFFLENNFRNNLFRSLRIPWLQNTKYHFIIFANAGWIERADYKNPGFKESRIYETGFGLGNIFTFFRFDFAWRLNAGKGNPFSFNLLSNIEF